MKGYLVNFFKYAPIVQPDNEQLKPLDQNCVRSVVWSAFDRVEIRSVENFNEYRTAGYSEKHWIGERQFAMIYEIEEEIEKERLIYNRDTTKKCKFVFHPRHIKGTTSAYRFFGISLVDFTPEWHDYLYAQENSLASIRNRFIEIIDKLIKDNLSSPNAICYEIYGTLGSNDIVIIWLCNQFDDLVKILEALRLSTLCCQDTQKTVGLISNISTVMGISDIDNDKISYNDVRGKLNIRITHSEQYNPAEFRNFIAKGLGFKDEELSIATILGEHDLLISIDGNKLTNSLYKEGGLIHIRAEQFRSNCIQSNTEISVFIDYESIHPYQLKVAEISARMNVSGEERNQIKKMIESLVGQSIFSSKEYLGETLWILYSDYIKNIASVFSFPWIKDLHFQFNHTLHMIDHISASNTIAPSMKYKQIEFLIDNMWHAMLHISQANRLFFEVPNTHLKHTGTYSKILHYYHGYVKQLLKLGYAIPKTSKQTPIVPFIVFDAIPLINSSTCITDENAPARIVRIKMPYDALINIPKYTKLLTHEVFHFIAPPDRKIRNELMGIITITIIITQIYLSGVKEAISKLTLVDGTKQKIIYAYKSLIEENVLSILMNDFPQIRKFIPNYEPNVEGAYYYKSITDAFERKAPNKFSFYVCDLIEKIPWRKIKNHQVVSNVPELQNNLRSIKSKIRKSCKAFFEYSNSLNDILQYYRSVQFAMREVLPDFFMLQITGMSLNEYLNEVLTYKDTFDDPRKNNVITMYRIWLIVRFVFFKEQSFNDIGEVHQCLMDNTSFDEEKLRYVEMCYLQAERSIGVYSSLIQEYFSLIEISEDRDGPLDELNKIHSLFMQQKVNQFDRNILFIESFQKQDALEDINTNKNTLPITEQKNSDIICSSKPSFLLLGDIIEDVSTISNIDELFSVLNETITRISDNLKEDPIWFRGQTDVSYRLIPTLYRMKNKKDRFYNKDLRKVMGLLIDDFKVASFNAPEIYPHGDMYEIGTLASMQHYSVPTNILDWTTSPFIALYFALENVIEKRENSRQDVSLFVLNPVRLNAANTILNKSKESAGKEPVPALWGNTAQYSSYLNLESTESTGSSKVNPYPLAVNVPFVNQRIKSQSGTFTMFSLDAKAENIDGDKSFINYDLMEMQKKYMKDFCQQSPFIARINISQSCVEALAEWLQIMGFRKHNVYPELSNISQRITENLKHYLDKD